MNLGHQSDISIVLYDMYRINLYEYTLIFSRINMQAATFKKTLSIM